ncbi:hypothetical protein [Sulfurospirillum sp. SCADC]|uniref:hypothetical protein n=1 Tax=Sulfurospirillum sp. SCADC TaxID=1537915 RepID=UPI0005029F9C|nr:hypothetical protein [Sulfurospirillum sp. SCADC]KFL32960.1 hypothetical protein JU57_13810 [Sulfurospirillum sp. SCADC]
MEVKNNENKKIVLDAEEAQLLSEIEAGEWYEKPLDKQALSAYQNHAKYIKSLNEKRQNNIRFSVSDLAVLKAKSKELGIGYQNLIQALVHNYVKGDN